MELLTSISSGNFYLKRIKQSMIRVAFKNPLKNKIGNLDL